MRIISQNGRVDIKYEDISVHVESKESFDKFVSEKWILLLGRTSNGNDFLLGSFDTLEEAKAMLLAIAKGWRHNYQIFYCSEKEEY